MQEKYIKPDLIKSMYSHSMGAFDDEGATYDPDFLEEYDLHGPNLRALMNVWASVIWAYYSYYDNPQVKPHIVVGGNHHWGGEKAKQPLGQLQAEATLKVLREYNIPGYVTLLKHWMDEATGKTYEIVETSGEIIAHTQLAQSLHYDRIGFVSSQTHVPSIVKSARFHTEGTDVKAYVFSAEGILHIAPDHMQKPVYTATQEHVLLSEDEKQFKKRERVKNIILMLLGKSGESFLRRKATAQRVTGTYTTSTTEVFENSLA